MKTSLYNDIAMEMLNDKLSIKNLLFTKALPNYVIPVPVNGHKVFACTDCGDKFIFESSFNDHVNRKSMKITYMCRYCNQSRTFYNRCNLLLHIRSHVFKTATINVTDLKVEPLPLSIFKIPVPAEPSTNVDSVITTTTTVANEASPATRKPAGYSSVHCLECKMDLTNSGTAYRDRTNHYMQYSNEVYSCPVCLFALPSICAVKTHLRLHLRCPPYYCPECGVHLANKNIHYPYNHDCEGFKMMRATARLKCALPECRLFHPNDYKSHMKEYHMKKVYKCPFCVVACFNEQSMQKHLKCHNTETKALLFYKCELCPGKFVLQSRIDGHLKTHKVTSAFPCWPCGAVFKDVSVLLHHFQEKHNKNEAIDKILNNILSEYEMYTKDFSKPKRVYRVVKRCDQCRRSFTYRCQYNEIHNLPNECPYKCTSTLELDVMPDKTQNNTSITCHLCKTNISQDWSEIKKHYAALHKTHKCVDAKIVLARININKYLSERKISSSRNIIKKTINKKISRKNRRRQNKKPSSVSSDVENVTRATHASGSKVSDDLYVCNMCGDNFEQKLLLEKHLVSHRDPCMAYQCMECGQSFVVKPTFSKHLLLEHNISDAEDYITRKQCYNVNALMKYQTGIVSNEPLRENQCQICREEFSDPEDLEKHFRVHGMAFLMKNNSNKINNVS